MWFLLILSGKYDYSAFVFQIICFTYILGLSLDLLRLPTLMVRLHWATELADVAKNKYIKKWADTYF